MKINRPDGTEPPDVSGDAESDLAEVIAMPGLRPMDDRPLEVPLRRRGWNDRCHCHAGTVIDEDAHTVLCAKCNAQLDPVQVLKDYANAWDRLRNEWEEARRNASAAEARVQVLLRHERNARARLRRQPAHVRLHALCAQLAAHYESDRTFGHGIHDLLPSIRKAVADLDGATDPTPEV